MADVLKFIFGWIVVCLTCAVAIICTLILIGFGLGLLYIFAEGMAAIL